MCPGLTIQYLFYTNMYYMKHIKSFVSLRLQIPLSDYNTKYL